MKIPLVIRLLIGRGWGQGPQHSQSLQSLFAHIPGIKVIMPVTPYDAKGLLVSAIEDDNPVIFMEHRWLHNVSGDVPEEIYRIPLGMAKIVKEGEDLTVVSSSYMTLEAIRAAEELKNDGINAEIVDLRTIKPLDIKTILDSVSKTGRIMVVDGAWPNSGLAAEILAQVIESNRVSLKCTPKRICFPDAPTPTSPMLAKYFYPRAVDIVNKVREDFGIKEKAEKEPDMHSQIALDIPDRTFKGPF